MFACLASHKSAEPDTLVVRMDMAARDALIADDPETYYLKEHYVGYPCVLVRLSRVRADALKDLAHRRAPLRQFCHTPNPCARNQAASFGSIHAAILNGRRENPSTRSSRNRPRGCGRTCRIAFLHGAGRIAARAADPSSRCRGSRSRRRQDCDRGTPWSSRRRDPARWRKGSGGLSTRTAERSSRRDRTAPPRLPRRATPRAARSTESSACHPTGRTRPPASSSRESRIHDPTAGNPRGGRWCPSSALARVPSWPSILLSAVSA